MKTAKQPAYTLFGTSACHLCEVAQEMIESLCEENPQLNYEKVDISDSETLFALYGIRIPVLRNAAGRELGWPFSPAQLREFMV
ncbi:MAG: glutaredoxin family protein [Pseudomonadales bacterium]|nr:glutaredoxin family protein [Halioglobus sp.]MCP5131093.1 glutaredoxin family protein [Pseudomonadales bacterium]